MPTPEISKITLPSGTTYQIKDEVARRAQSGAMHWLGITTTPITDGSTTTSIVIDGVTITVGADDAGGVVGYDDQEFIWSGTAWQEFGSTGSLGALAFEDSATGAYTPAGTISGTAVQLATTTINSITDVGSLPSLTMSVANETLTIAFSQGTLPTKGGDTTVATGTVTSITQPTFTGTAATITVS